MQSLVLASICCRPCVFFSCPDDAMNQSAADRPDPTLLRKAAIIQGGVADHAGRVRIEPIENFDLNRTIFQTLEGALPRFIMKRRIAKDVFWGDDEAKRIESDYAETRENVELPAVSDALIRFLVDECDFDVEHAEGSFLDHLYFGFEYAVQHFPQHSPIVMLLHSILGTGTNTFAMEAAKIPQLKELVTDFEFRHIEAFPTVLRLLYLGQLVDELKSNSHRAGKLRSITMYRVIDNAPIEMSGADLWIQLNYQLMHLIDFLPAANWVAHQSDTSFILFRELHALLGKAGRLEASVGYTPASGARKLEGEDIGLLTRLITHLPVSVVRKKAAQSIANFSERVGHSTSYSLNWD
jgi:hypothetical protein